jgi:hypothetical protein
MGAAVDRLRELSGSIAVSPFSQVRLHCSPLGRDGGWVSRLGCCCWSIGAAITVNELVGKPVPFLRWSFLTMML